MAGGRIAVGVAVLALLAGCTAEPEVAQADPRRAPTTAEATGPIGVQPRDGEVGRITSMVISSIPTKRNIVFLTIDDGWEQDPGFVQRVRDQRIPITVFAMRDAVEAVGAPDQSGGVGRYVGAGKWGYFRELRDAGVSIENHTLTHPDLRGLGFDAQKREICGAGKVIRKEIGAKPSLFRPPFGTYNTDTLRAAKACGVTSVLLWTATVQPGGKIAYQVPDKKLRPGDIILMHFRPNLAHDFKVLLRKIKRKGFELGNLQSYLKAAA